MIIVILIKIIKLIIVILLLKVKIIFKLFNNKFKEIPLNLLKRFSHKMIQIIFQIPKNLILA